MTAASPADASSAQIMLANPRGFCAGVERAIEIVERVLRLRGAPVFVKHEIVHNRFVCDSLRARGVVFIEDPRLAEPGRPLVYSAHGVSKAVQEAARARGLEIFDATCPLVVKVHAEVARLRRDGFAVVMIGHRGHPEVEGTLGQASGGVFLVETEADIQRTCKSPIRKKSRSSRKRLFRSTTPPTLSRLCGGDFRPRARRAKTTFATRLKTGKTRSKKWRRNAI